MDINRFRIGKKHEYYRVQELALHNKHLIDLRWVYGSALTIVAVVTALISDLPWERAMLYLIIGLTVLMFNAVFQLANGYLSSRHEPLVILTVAQIVLDVIVMSGIIYVLGGIDARSTILFAIPVVAAGLLFSKRAVYAVAAFGSLGYLTSIVIYEFTHRGGIDLMDMLVPVVFYPAALFVLAYLLNYLLEIKVRYTREQANDVFLDMLSHSLIHPASTASAILDVLEEESGAQNEQTKRYLRMLKKENTDLVHLIHNLIETASESTLHRESVDIVGLISETASRVAKAHRRGKDLEISAPKKAPIEVDQNKLTMAVSNVLDNAFKYSSPETPVEVEIQAREKLIKVSIADKGEGMPDDIAKRAMDKYSISSTRDYASQGLGLGLAVAHKIISRHQGEMHIDSSHKKGTKVIIELKRKDIPRE